MTNARFNVVLAAALAAVSHAATAGTVTQQSSFSIPKSPSGLFYYPDQKLLYVLCGTKTNGDHTLYAYTTSGAQRCEVTIPASAKMARVDGFQIVGSTAYIVDSQGPMHASSLGGSMYAVTWTNPCSCQSDGTCSSSSVTWSPTVTKTYVLSASDASIGDGGGNDNYFRNSGVVIKGQDFYAVNGVHPVSGLTCCFPKSLIKAPLSGTGVPVSQKWSFTGTTVGRNVDMEGLTCGADGCSSFLYIGDEYNYIYKLKLSSSDPATAVETEWDLNSIVGNVKADKGIEALTYSSDTGFFYAGIQDTSKIHVVSLTDPNAAAGPAASPTPAPPAANPMPAPAASPTPSSTPTPATSPTPAPTAAPTTAVSGARTAVLSVVGSLLCAAALL